MKKIYISIATLLFCGSMLMAQTPANRTTKTVVADVLAQMPVAKQKEYNKLIKELSATGEEGVRMLVERINAPGKGSNMHVDYALSGLSHYVMAKGKEAERATVERGYLKALEQVNERETKAFIIRQLQILGKNESVEALSFYLNDEELSAPAAAALSAIATPEAGKALIAALKMRMGSAATQNNVIQAIGEAGIQDAEELLLTLLASGTPELQQTLCVALGQVGGAASLNQLAEAAAADGYRMQKRGACDAYLLLLGRLIEQGEAKDALKAAQKLQKAAEKEGQTQTQIAALRLTIAAQLANGVEPVKAAKPVWAALKGSNRDYRNAALASVAGLGNADLYQKLVKQMQKATPEVKADVLHWMRREAATAENRTALLPYQDVLVKLLADADFQVKQAAAWALVRMGDASAISSLTALLKDADREVILLGQDALAAFPGDINAEVAGVVGEASDAGKIAALELLAMRKAASGLPTVLGQIQAGSPEVKKAAYTALKDVVEQKDIHELCRMLEAADAQAVPFLQEALVAAIAPLPAKEQVQVISQRMKQAGNKDDRYYLVLASTGEPKVLDVLVKAFRSNSGDRQQAAFQALLQWKDDKVADELYTICKENPNSSYFNPALNAYIKLVSNASIKGEKRLLNLRKAMEIARTDAQKRNVLKQIEKTGTFLGMLYAGEFLDQKPVQQAAANAVMNIALGNKQYFGTNVRALLDKVIEVLDNPDARYQKEAVRKHLAEMPKGEGFVSIFNGKDLTGWKGLVENPLVRAKMKPAQLAKAQKKADEEMNRDWKVENGCLVYEGKGFNNICTDKQYGDFEMYVDWMLDPAGPEADAGIYLRGTPQVQIWDTARTNVGAQVGSGGLYNNKQNVSKPTKVADNKLGEWNSFYIRMVGDRVTVILNGEKVVDDVILENYWDRKSPIFPIEQIELQAHGSKVYYRNIYVKELERKEPFKLSAEEQKEGFKILFDGTNMHQWTGNTVDYTLEDQTISMNPSKSFGGNLYTKEEYGNFIFRFDFKLTPGANNGVGIRTPMKGDAAYVGMEVQVLDCEHPIYKDITPLQHHGSVYGIIPAKADHHSAFKPAGEWNTEEILADGDYIRVTVNGVVITEGNIREATKNGTPDGKKHPGLFNKKGHIGFLGHGSPVQFRNIRIKELK